MTAIALSRRQALLGTAAVAAGAATLNGLPLPAHAKAPFAKDQRSPQAAQALMHSEVVRWSQVVRDNNIQPSE